MNLTDDVCMEKDDVYQMVETTAYFEAYRHVLEGLQKVRPDELPFQVAAVICCCCCCCCNNYGSTG